MTQLNVQQLLEKWAPVLDADGVEKISSQHRRETTAVLLENTEQDLKQTRQAIMEAGIPATATQGYPTDGTGLAKYDPVLISMVRRAAPQMIAYDICGVQPLRQPTGLIFALRSKYGTQSGPEALFNEANTAFSGAATPTHAGTDPTADFVDQDAGTAGDQFGTFTTGNGVSTQVGETFGAGGASPAIAEMSFSVEQMTVTAKTRALKAGYTAEFAQDLRNLHGLDADAELSNILSTEILGEVNREVLRTIYSCARVGAQDATKAGVFDLLTDSDGRWLAERHKGLLFQIEREANRIAQETRRGKGNILICSSDVASALALAGVLDYAPALQGASNLNVDESSATFAGILNKRFKVYVDPYAGVAGTQSQFFLVGYKGASAWDAGLFYAPYVPLQIVKTTDHDTFTPRMAYRMRYGIAKHPFFNTVGRTNSYYRIAAVRNIL